MYQQCPGAVGPVPDGTRLGQPFGISRWMRSSGGLCLPARERELAWAALPRGADHPDKREAGPPYSRSSAQMRSPQTHSNMLTVQPRLVSNNLPISLG
jgi:hypothetical protein